MSGPGAAGNQVIGRAGQRRPVPAGFSTTSRSSTVKAQGTGQLAQRHTLLTENKTAEGDEHQPQSPRTAHARSSVSRTTVAGGGTVRHGSVVATAEAPEQARSPAPTASAAAPTVSSASRTTVAGGATTRHSSHNVAQAPAPAMATALQSPEVPSQYRAAAAAPAPAMAAALQSPEAPSQPRATAAAPAWHSGFVAEPEARKVAQPPVPAPSRNPQGFTTSAQSRTVVQGQLQNRRTMGTSQAAPERLQANREPEAPSAPRSRGTRSVAPTPPQVQQFHAHFSVGAPAGPEAEPTIHQRVLRAAGNAAAARVQTLLNPEPPPYTEQPAPAQKRGEALPPAAPRHSVWGAVKAWSHRVTRAVKKAVRDAVFFVRDTVARIWGWFARLLGFSGSRV